MSQKNYRNNLVLNDKTSSWHVNVRVLSSEKNINRKMNFGTKIWKIKVILN